MILLYYYTRTVYSVHIIVVVCVCVLLLLVLPLRVCLFWQLYKDTYDISTQILLYFCFVFELNIS